MNRRQTEVRGHGLLAEGRAMTPSGRHSWFAESCGDGSQWFWLDGTFGPAVCRCGVTSDALPSTAARRRWHNAHKDEIRRSQQEPAA